MSILFYLSIAVFVMLCVLLCFVILIQESKTMGLGASFGGDASTSMFGTSTADVLKKFTSWMAVIFMVSCVVLSLWTSSMSRGKQAELAPLVEETQ